MPTLRKGNMFDFSKETPDVLLFTGNSTVTKNVRLVMGRGAALEAKNKFQGCDSELGNLINVTTIAFGPDYKIITCARLINRWWGIKLGVFQVKYHYAESAKPHLIAASARMLNDLCLKYNWDKFKIWLNFPGIGAGNLTKETVWPLIKDLPENVMIWEKT